jgi:hypothetical protein
MILLKDKRTHKLDKHIDFLYEISIEVKSYQWFRLMNLNLQSMYELIEKNDDCIGLPTHSSIDIERQEILVYPRPSENFKCQILGGMLITQ